MSFFSKDIGSYLNYTFQFFTSLLIATGLGYWVDNAFLKNSFLIWVLPTIVVLASLVLVVIKTSPPQKKK